MRLIEKVKRIKQILVLLADNSKKRWLIFGMMLFVLFFIFIFKVNLSNKIDILNGSDEWDYQTIAVNFATGHGFHVTGNFEKPEVYKFGSVDKGTYEKQKILKGFVNIHRPPLYPLFIGLIYKMFGVNPFIIVILQLLLLCIVAAGLPMFGYFLWRSKGFYIGIVSGLIFMCVAFTMADVFLPGQAFTAFWVFIFAFIAETFFRKKTPLWAAIMAFVLAVSLLFHGTMVAVACFTVIYLLADLIKGKKWIKVYNLIAFCIVFFILLLPWHLYAFKTLHVIKHESSVVLSATLDTTLTNDEKVNRILKNAPEFGQYLIPQKVFTVSEINKIKDSLIPDVKNKGVFLDNMNASTTDLYKLAFLQEIIDAPDYFIIILSIVKNVEMDCHNEFVYNGSPNPVWRFNPKSFYNNDNLNNKISYARVINFYKHNPQYILPIIMMKVNLAINYSVYLKLFLFLAIFYFLSKALKIESLNRFLLLFFIIFCLIWTSAYLLPVLPVNILLLVYSFFLFLNCIFKTHHEIPLSFNLVFFNLMLFTVTTLGNYRYFKVLDAFFVLLCVFYLQKILKILIINIKPVLKKNAVFQKYF